jgi:hypothetical protein
MSDLDKGNAEEVLGAAFATITSLIVELGNLLVAKGIISRQEFASLVTQKIAAVKSGKHQEMMRSILQTALKSIQQEHD